MKWAYFLTLVFIVFLTILYEWPKINPEYKKEKVAFALFTLAGTVLLTVLIFYPDVQGPFDWFKKMYGPWLSL